MKTELTHVGLPLSSPHLLVATEIEAAVRFLQKALYADNHIPQHPVRQSQRWSCTRGGGGLGEAVSDKWVRNATLGALMEGMITRLWWAHLPSPSAVLRAGIRTNASVSPLDRVSSTLRLREDMHETTGMYDRAPTVLSTPLRVKSCFQPRNCPAHGLALRTM